MTLGHGAGSKLPKFLSCLLLFINILSSVPTEHSGQREWLHGFEVIGIDFSYSPDLSVHSPDDAEYTIFFSSVHLRGG